MMLSYDAEQWIKEPFYIGYMDDEIKEAVERKGWTITYRPRTRTPSKVLARGRLGVYEVDSTDYGVRAILVGP